MRVLSLFKDNLDAGRECYDLYREGALLGSAQKRPTGFDLIPGALLAAAREGRTDAHLISIARRATHCRQSTVEDVLEALRNEHVTISREACPEERFIIFRREVSYLPAKPKQAAKASDGKFF